MSRSRVSLVRDSDRSADREAARLIPLETVVAVLEWPVDADDEDGNLAGDVVADLTQALLKFGRVAFRWYNTPLPGVSRTYCRPNLPVGVKTLRRLADWFAPHLIEPVFDVVTTSDPAVARALFLYSGWIWAGQAALVYDAAGDDPPDIVSRLQRGLDWSRAPLPPSARLLFGPGHDGAFAMVAARTTADIEMFEHALNPAGSSAPRA